MRITGATRVAGVVGRPVTHSLSPLIHNAWIDALGIDAVYIPFSVTPAGFPALVEGLRGGGVRGLNVTLPFKGQALAAADRTSPMAAAAGAANLLTFTEDGTIVADNTDGHGLLAAFSEQAPGWRADDGPVLLLGAGGAAQGAIAALLEAGAPEVRVVNRTRARAEALAASVPRTSAHTLADFATAAGGAAALVNATSAGLVGETLTLDLAALPAHAIVMDMVYAPLRTPLLRQAQARGLRTVDGLAMLIGQARPSFEAFFGQSPPSEVDVRTLCLAELERRE